MSLLVPVVLGDEVEVFSADDECAVHLGRNNGAGQDAATDGDETGKWALLVCDGLKVSTVILRYSFNTASMLCGRNLHPK